MYMCRAGKTILTLVDLQVVLIKQEKVPCLIDNDAHLALDPSDAYAVQTKPHGHGDVHGLLHRSGLAQQWQQEGLQWVCFFQVRML
jgi:UDP-sugar pyrophosphorylase